MRKAIISLVVFVLLSGCAGWQAEVETSGEGPYGPELNRMDGNVLPEPFPSSVTSVELNAERYRTEAGEVLYNLIVEYSSTDWLFIKPGKSLILTVDGDRIGLKGEGSGTYREIHYGGRATEKAWFGVSLYTLKRLAEAEKVRVRIVGSRRTVDRYFSSKNFHHFQRFVEDYGT